MIRNLPAEKLAELLVTCETRPMYDEGMDGEWGYVCDEDFYITSDGEKFYEDFEEAVEHEIEWLNSECKNEQSINIR